MSIAWATVALLVILLPGFFFFIGLYSTRQFSHDVAPKNVVGQLAAIVAASFFTHSLLLSISYFKNKVNLFLVFVALQVTGTTASDKATIIELSKNMLSHSLDISFYVFITSFIGFMAGLFTAVGAMKIFKIKLKTEMDASKTEWTISSIWEKALSKIPIGFIFEHRWLYEAINFQKSPENKFNTTYAYILTKIQEEQRILTYIGALAHLGLEQDGKISYIVIQKPSRFYLKLDKRKSITTAFIEIGSTHKPEAIDSDKDKKEYAPANYMYVSGNEINNILFKTYKFTADENKVKTQIKNSIEKIKKATEEDLSLSTNNGSVN